MNNTRTIKLIILLLCFVGGIQFYREAIVDNNSSGGHENELGVVGVGEPSLLVVGDATSLEGQRTTDDDDGIKHENEWLLQQVEAGGVIAKEDVENEIVHTNFTVGSSSSSTIKDVFVDHSADVAIKGEKDEEAIVIPPNKYDNEEEQVNNTSAEEESINEFTNETNKLNNNNKEEEETTLTTTTSSSSSPPVEKIILLGERHSGTNWITDHLTECFDIEVFSSVSYYMLCMSYVAVHLFCWEGSD